MRDTWIVAKFGGTSVASAQRWERISQIVDGHRAAGRNVLVVCSAIAGVTDLLIELDDALARGETSATRFNALVRIHHDLADALGVDRAALTSEIASLRQTIRDRTHGADPAARAALLAHGELLSSRIAAAYLRGRFEAALCDARTLLIAEPTANEVDRYLSARCVNERAIDVRAVLAGLAAPVVVTQGFIVRTEDGRTALLGRGGSDASAAHLAAAVDAAALEIWSDVPGLFTMDPRHSSDARLLRWLDYDEAFALANLGAKALHPRALHPCRARGIVLRLGWTDRPELHGTRIGARRCARGARGVTARRELALIAIETTRPACPLASIVSHAERLGVPIDHIASTGSEVRFTVDLAASPSAREALAALLAELRPIGKTTQWLHVASVSAHGVRCVPRAFHAASPLLVMHAPDASHVSAIVDARLASTTVAAAHVELFDDKHLDPAVFGPRWSELYSTTEAHEAGDTCARSA
jgi:diaminopimelate decarboxylase/aspartate kinase